MPERTIQLTPEELILQGNRLQSISNRYRATLDQVDTVLKRVNQNWSYRLANNFSTKIHSVAKSSEKLVAMLEQSATAAQKAGESFSTIDSQLAKLIGGGAENQEQGSTKTLQTDMQTEPVSLKDVADLFDKLCDKHLTEEERTLIEMTLKQLLGSEYIKLSKIVKKIVQGHFDWKTAVDTVSLGFDLFGKKNMHFDAIWKTLKTFPKYAAISSQLEKEFFESVEKDGIGFAAVNYIHKSFYNLEKEFVDISCQLVDNLFKFSEMSAALEFMYGWDINGAFEQCSSAINQFFDETVGGVYDNLKDVGKGIVNFAKSLF